MKILCIQLSPHVLPALGRGLSNSVGALILAQDRHCPPRPALPRQVPALVGAGAQRRDARGHQRSGHQPRVVLSVLG